MAGMRVGEAKLKSLQKKAAKLVSAAESLTILFDQEETHLKRKAEVTRLKLLRSAILQRAEREKSTEISANMGYNLAKLTGSVIGTGLRIAAPSQNKKILAAGDSLLPDGPEYKVKVLQHEEQSFPGFLFQSPQGLEGMLNILEQRSGQDLSHFTDFLTLFLAESLSKVHSFFRQNLDRYSYILSPCALPLKTCNKSLLLGFICSFYTITFSSKLFQADIISLFKVKR